MTVKNLNTVSLNACVRIVDIRVLPFGLIGEVFNAFSSAPCIKSSAIIAQSLF